MVEPAPAPPASSNYDPAAEDAAAIVVQAAARGYTTRKAQETRAEAGNDAPTAEEDAT